MTAPLLLLLCVFACTRRRAGSYVANRVADKISILADNVYICRSGSVRVRHTARRKCAAHAGGCLAAEERTRFALSRAAQP
jgi:hypothetical protein